MKIIFALAIIASAGSTLAAESSNLRDEQGNRNLRGGLCKFFGTCPTKYIADFGKYGKVVMKVKGGDFDMNINLKKISEDFFGDTKVVDGVNKTSTSSNGFAYHLHSGQAYGIGAKPDGTKDFCGGSYTSGHYDSNLGCGSASTARSEDLCLNDNDVEVAASGNTADPPGNYPFAEGVIDGGSGGCEVGDLSCVNGPLTISNKRVNAAVTGPCPKCDDEYLDPNTSNKQGAFDTWYSLVLHDRLTGARVLCANFRKV